MQKPINAAAKVPPQLLDERIREANRYLISNNVTAWLSLIGKDKQRRPEAVASVTWSLMFLWVSPSPGLRPAKHTQCGVALVWRLNKSLPHDKHSPAAKGPNESRMSFLQLWLKRFITLNLVNLPQVTFTRELGAFVTPKKSDSCTLSRFVSRNVWILTIAGCSTAQKLGCVSLSAPI